jgi:hypothetical protein
LRGVTLVDQQNDATSFMEDDGSNEPEQQTEEKDPSHDSSARVHYRGTRAE